ncbi:hypothetical protein LTR78_001665 [Recurvomyces mirabilis]|uniref:Uncharacterized protein n=1 Tax=Recurvomyces mirabilis TaxID=574656 RepID=A0AAE0WV11_9PEZI|nr:hypothetical protein LTR78_001665 [Recurvomyces mirabilis]KAK5151765.1 hypothetical protein LTS14_008897 [Recurvomyces mirabilis]
MAAAGLLVSTVEKLSLTASKFKNYALIVKGYRSRLKATEQSYKNWKQKWNREHGVLLPNEELEYVLGAQHLRDRASNLELLRYRNIKVATAISKNEEPDINDGSYSVTEDDDQSSSEHRRKKRRAVSSEGPMKEDWETWDVACTTASMVSRSVARKIIGVLWRSEHLSQSLTELERAMNTLDTLSSGALEELRAKLDLTSTISPGEQVHAIWSMRNHREKFSSILTRLHQEVTWTSPGYGVVLSEPQGDDWLDLKCLEHERVLATDLLTAQPPCSDSPISQRVRVPYPLQARAYVNEAALHINEILNGALGGPSVSAREERSS